jgi:hypothetical protein
MTHSEILHPRKDNGTGQFGPVIKPRPDFELPDPKAIDPETGLTGEDFDTMYRHVIVAALWSTADYSDDSEDGGDDMLDAMYGVEDISDQAAEKIREEMTGFLTGSRDLVQEALARPGYGDKADGNSLAQLGHDFQLTRNGHGAGFWDREALEAGGLGKKLSEAAYKFESNGLYSQNGMIYAE